MKTKDGRLGTAPELLPLRPSNTENKRDGECGRRLLSSERNIARTIPRALCGLQDEIGIRGRVRGPDDADGMGYALLKVVMRFKQHSNSL